MQTNDGLIPRPNFLKLATVAFAAGLALLAGAANALAAEPVPLTTKAPEAVVANPGVLRIASVSTAVEGDLLPSLVKRFEAETGIKTVLIRNDDPYEPAEKGEYDIVISHFGHRDVENFVLKGFGLWPRTVFSNQLALVGPPSDPAKIKGVTSLVEAFKRIARTKSPYVLNDTRGLRYLTDTLWYASGKPPKGSWFIEPGVKKKDAIALAAEENAYVLWGLTPFLRDRKGTPRGLVPLVTGDSMLQRIMVTIVVNPEKIPGVNSAAAAKFQEFLLKPEIQAIVLQTYYPGVKQAVWAAAGRHNPGYALPE